MAISRFQLRISRERLPEFGESIVPLLGERDEVCVEVSETEADVTLALIDPEKAERVHAVAKASGFDVNLPQQPFDVAAPGEDVSRLAAQLAARGVNLACLGTVARPPFFPLVPMPSPSDDVALNCDDPPRIVADGFGNGSEGGLGTFAEDRRKALVKARSDAVAQAQSAVASTSFKCPRSCSLQYDVLFGKPIEAVVSEFSVGALSVTSKVLFAQPWEVQVQCRRTPTETGPTVDTPALTSPSCNTVTRGGLGSDMQESDLGTGPLQQEIDAEMKRLSQKAREAAWKDAFDQIVKALTDLPRCPVVSCPVESLTVVLGPPDVRSSVTQELAMLLLHYIVRASAKIPWRVERKCSKS
jgi:hypothetical protein